MKKAKKIVACMLCAAAMLLSSCDKQPPTVQLSEFASEYAAEPIDFTSIYARENELFNYFAVLDDTHTAVISSSNDIENYTDYFTYTVYENGEPVYEKQISNRFDALCYDPENDCLYSYNNFDDKYYRLDREFNIIGTVMENLGAYYIKSSHILDGKLWFIAAMNFPSESVSSGESTELQEMIESGTLSDYSSEGEELYIVDLKDGSVHKPDIPNVICDFCDGKTMYCYTCKDNKYELCRLDKNGEIEAKTTMTDTGYVRAFFIRGSDLLYSTNKSMFFTKKDLTTGLVTSKEEDIFAHDSRDFTLYKGNLIINNKSDYCIIAYGQHSEEPAANELKHAGETLVLGQLQNGYIYFKIGDVSKDTGIELTTAQYPYEYDDLLLKLMAGDSDIDIYFFGPDMIGRNIRRNGIYEDMSGSAVLQNEFSRYFDYLSDFCRNGNDIWCVPISLDQIGTFYIPDNMTAAGIDPAELTTFDGYFGALEKAKAARPLTYYSYFGTFSQVIRHHSYNINYSYIDYDTELYRYLFRRLYDGWNHSETQGEHPLFNNPNNPIVVSSRDMLFDTEKIIFKTGNFGDMIPDDNCMDNWRAVPLPHITGDTDKNPALLEYAVINPFSTKKEAALELLEYVAVNISKYGKTYSSGSSAYFFYKDKSDYNDIYDTGSPLFDDIYTTYANAAIWEAAYPMEADYWVWEYQDGRYSMEDIVEHLNHITEIAQNE